MAQNDNFGFLPNIIDRLRQGEIIKCTECKSGVYQTNASDKAVAKEFQCNHCGRVIRISPNITID